MNDDLGEMSRKSIRDLLSVMLDWRVHAGTAIAVGGVLVATLLGYRGDPGPGALIIGVVIGVAVLIIRHRERREREEEG